jgi:phage tail-like protein
MRPSISLPSARTAHCPSCGASASSIRKRSRGYSISADLWNWWQALRQSKAHRKSGIIVLLNEAREPVLIWEIRDAWIKKWEGPTLRPKTNEVAIESLEIVCEGIALTN